MTVPNILQYARELTSTSSASTGFSDASLLPYLNMVYHTVENHIVSKIDEDYFVSEFYTNTVADQERYEWQGGSSTTVGFKKILEVMVKWKTTDTKYSIIKSNENRHDSQSNDRDAVIATTV